MSAQTTIEWTDKSWNPIRGCTRKSEGCRFCYAEAQAGRFSGPGQPYAGLVRKTSQGYKWTGEVRLIEKDLETPLRWRKPYRIFVNSMSDLFHESVEDPWLDRLMTVMALAPRHTFQILTKRAQRMHDYMRFLTHRMGGPRSWFSHIPQWQHDLLDANPVRWPLPNVWLGVSVENQATAAERLPWLRQTPAATRFLSCEPLLEDLGTLDLAGIQWVIVGGESGPNARPCDIRWIMSLVEQCHEAQVPVFVKQLGRRPIDSHYQYGMFAEHDRRSQQAMQDLGMDHVGFNLLLLKDAKGGDLTAWPAGLAVQQFPTIG